MVVPGVPPGPPMIISLGCRLPGTSIPLARNAMRRSRRSDGTTAQSIHPIPPCTAMSLSVRRSPKAKPNPRFPRRFTPTLRQAQGKPSQAQGGIRHCGTGPTAPLPDMRRGDGCYPHGVPVVSGRSSRASLCSYAGAIIQRAELYSDSFLNIWQDPAWVFWPRIVQSGRATLIFRHHSSAGRATHL